MSAAHAHNHSHDHGRSHGHSGHLEDSKDTHGHDDHDHAHTNLGALSQAQEVLDEVCVQPQLCPSPLDYCQVVFHLLIVAENLNEFSRLVTVSSELYSYHLKDVEYTGRHPVTALV